MWIRAAAGHPTGARRRGRADQPMRRCSTGPLSMDFTCRLTSSASTSVCAGFETGQRVARRPGAGSFFGAVTSFTMSVSV